MFLSLQFQPFPITTLKDKYNNNKVPVFRAEQGKPWHRSGLSQAGVDYSGDRREAL